MSYFCHAADEDPSLLLIHHDCALST